MVTRGDDIGGAQIHVRDMSLALRKIGHEVAVFVGQEGMFTKNLQLNDVEYYDIKNLIRPIHPLKDLLAFFESYKLLKVFNPDLISCHSSKAGWLGRLVGYCLGTPTIFTAHGWSFSEGIPKIKSRLFILAEKIVSPLSKLIITVSEYDYRLASSHNISPKTRLLTIHNGMPEISSEYNTNQLTQPPKIVMLARFDNPKDHTMLVNTLALIKNEEWTLDFIGDGSKRAQVKKIVIQKGLSAKISFLGTRNNIPLELSTAQIFVLLSHWEGFPRSILEAMRAGLPVVASDVGGIKESVVDGSTGFLIPRGDVSILKDRLLKLIKNPTLRQKMGREGRKRFEENFTFAHMLEKHLKVYDAILNKGFE